jgi:signal peptide binding protein
MDFDGWTYDDFLRRLEAIRNFGTFEELANRIPGMDALLRDMDVDIRGQLEPIERILRAMTAEERLQPELIEGVDGHERRESIAERAGTTLGAVESLVSQFQRLREMLAERSLDEVTRELMDEAAPKREPWQESAEAWKAPSDEDEEDEDLAELEQLLDAELESDLEEDELLDEDLSDGAEEEVAQLTGPRLDELLRKISASGYDSLTPSERDDLERASAILRGS